MSATKFPVKEFYTQAELDKHLAVLQGDLSGTMERQAGYFAFYGAKAAEAESQHAKMEQRQELIAARLDQKIRNAAVTAGDKITEAQIKAQITLHPDMIAVTMAVNEAKMIASKAKSAAEAFRHRRDMLIQMAFNEREERKGELRLTEGTQRQIAQQEDRKHRMGAMFADRD